MDTERLAGFRHVLILLQSELETSISASANDTKPVEPDRAIGRLTRQDAMQAQQMALEIERRNRARLEAVGAALDRVKHGTYGACARCEDDISETRLRVRPEAPLCIHCAGGRT